MPILDFPEIFSSPEFMDVLTLKRTEQSQDADGYPVELSTTKPFSAIVTVDKSLQANRMAEGVYISGAILIITRERLIGGVKGYASDIVTYAGADYKVTYVDTYTRYGAGWVTAHCELMQVMPNSED